MVENLLDPIVDLAGLDAELIGKFEDGGLCRSMDTTATAFQRWRRTSENLEDAIGRAVGEPVSRADRDDAVHPVEFRGTGLEQRVHPKLVICRVDSLAPVQFLHDA